MNPTSFPDLVKQVSRNFQRARYISHVFSYMFRKQFYAFSYESVSLSLDLPVCFCVCQDVKVSTASFVSGRKFSMPS